MNGGDQAPHGGVLGSDSPVCYDHLDDIQVGENGPG